MASSSERSTERVEGPPSGTRAADWLIGGGAVGRAIRERDWGATELGPIEDWPHSLRTTVGLCLGSSFPFALAWGPSGLQLYNDAYRAICGSKHPAALGLSFREAWASTWPVLGPGYQRALEGQSSYVEDARVFLTRGGRLEEAFLTFSFGPIRDEQGRVSGVFHPVNETTNRVLGERRARLLRDLTLQLADARDTEQALQLAAHTLAGAATDVPFALFYSIDAGSSGAQLVARSTLAGLEACSPLRIDSAARTWPVHEVVRQNQPRFVHELESQFGVLRSGPYEESPITAVLLPITPPDCESPIAVLVAAASPRLPLDDDYRAFYELLAAAITKGVASARAHHEQRRRSEQLAQLDRAKTAFFSNVSHEFRTPLTLMAGPLEDELAETESPLPDPRRSRIEVAHRNTLRLLKLVNVLLDFSRIESGRVLASFQPTDLSTFTSELAGMFRSAVERAGLSLRLELEPLAEPVYVDRDMWEKVVLNLMSNAFKHTFRGQIAVRLRGEAERVVLEVSDTGVGIPAAEQAHLFERFHRVLGAQARSHEGTGIGLALVQELSQLHGGGVRVVSEPDVGSTFTVWLPRGSGHLPAAQVSQVSAPSPAGAGVAAYVQEALQWASNDPTAVGPPPMDEHPSARRDRVLLADDNQDIRDYVKRLLEPTYQVTTVADGQAALEAALESPPELVLSDVIMPRLDGFGLLRALRAEPKTQRLPVILLSARAGEDSAVEGLGSGADDYLVKPFSARELTARVRTHLELARIRRQWAEHLEQANQELEAFSYSVSHDLRTPLRAIDGFSKAVLSRHADQLDEQGKSYLQRVRAAATRMSELIDELLNLSRVSRATLHRQRTSLSTIARDVARGLQEQHPTRRVQITVEDELLAHVDSRLLQIVFENLLDNAWKFTARRRDPSVHVGRVAHDEPATFYVRDNGAGFDPTYAHRLFQPFQRLHAERDFSGTGVGLAIVYRIVTRHGGRIWAESGENEGATFYFTLTGHT